MIDVSWTAPGWIVKPPDPRPRCKVLVDPKSEATCQRPCNDHTALDLPICDDCWDAMRNLEGA